MDIVVYLPLMGALLIEVYLPLLVIFVMTGISLTLWILFRRRHRQHRSLS